MKVLVTCPPMLGLIDEFIPQAKDHGIDLVPAKVTQILSEAELIERVPHHDGWIIGDDPATRKVFEAGKAGKLKAAVKWGIGVDNVDFSACKDLAIPVTNTPNMFGKEVADIAVAYTIGLARQIFFIDQSIKANPQAWPKPAGISLEGKNVGLIGYGDIGKNTARRLLACEMNVTAYDPGVEGDAGIQGVKRANWPEQVEAMDFLIFTCALNQHTYHMLNEDILQRVKQGVYVINVARGPLIDEKALIAALQSQQVAAAALEVFEVEPLPADSALRSLPNCIFGSHNSSNTKDAVRRASHQALEHMYRFLNV